MNVSVIVSMVLCFRADGFERISEAVGADHYKEEALITHRYSS